MVQVYYSGTKADHFLKQDWSRLNPNVDREPAEVGRPNRKKLSIVLNQPGKKVSKTYSFTETFESMNWNNGQEIRRLNRWRSQIFLCVISDISSLRLLPCPDCADESRLTFAHSILDGLSVLNRITEFPSTLQRLRG